MGKKRYLDIDVLEMAKQRIRRIFETHDQYVVCFSGGKDSLAVLELTGEVFAEMGINESIKVVFRDEELIPDDVIDFVNRKRLDPRYDFRYYAIPLRSDKFILGKNFPYIQWDPSRRWIRPRPEWAISDPGGRVFSQYEADEFICSGIRGKVALVTGIRADESIIRLASCMTRRSDNYICKTDSPRISICKPLYDWSEKDIFRYFYDKQIKYCAIYDAQTWNNQKYRVSTPLHAEHAKTFFKLRTLYPVFYQQIVDLFPEMLVQERYWSALDRGAIIHKYPRSWSGIYQFIAENLEGSAKKKAIDRVAGCRKTREAREKEGVEFGGYPILYVFKSILNGAYKRSILPIQPNGITKPMREYESTQEAK